MLFLSLLHLLGPMQFLLCFKLLVETNTSKKNITFGLRIKATSKEKDSSIIAFTREYRQRKREKVYTYII